MSEINKRSPISITLPRAEYAAGCKLATGAGSSFSAWLGKMIRAKTREGFDLDIDNPTPDDVAKLEKWIAENTEEKRRHARKAKGRGKKNHKTGTD